MTEPFVTRYELDALESIAGILRRELEEKMAASGTPPHTDYWHRSVTELERMESVIAKIRQQGVASDDAGKPDADACPRCGRTDNHSHDIPGGHYMHGVYHTGSIAIANFDLFDSAYGVGTDTVRTIPISR